MKKWNSRSGRGGRGRGVSTSSSRGSSASKGNAGSEIFDPMRKAYLGSVGLGIEDDPGLAGPAAIMYKDTRTKDTPCRFHDGFSGKCWKGDHCPYSHKLYTGGKFAEKYPQVALEASLSRGITPVSNLPPKAMLHKLFEFKARVTYVETISDFFIRFANPQAVHCLCKDFEKKVLLAKPENDRRPIPFTNHVAEMVDGLEYGFGAGGLGMQEGSKLEDDEPIEVDPLIAAKKLDMYLNSQLMYKRWQPDTAKYLEHMELVAARVNDAWHRGIIIWQLDDKNDEADYTETCIRVQLIDTGEKVTVSQKDLCRLPPRFSNTPPMAYRCLLYGVLPVYLKYSQSAIDLFKALVLDKDVHVVVEHTNGAGSTFLEEKPYFVKIMATRDGEEIDVARELVKAGRALGWDSFPGIFT